MGCAAVSLCDVIVVIWLVMLLVAAIFLLNLLKNLLKGAVESGLSCHAFGPGVNV